MNPPKIIFFDIDDTLYRKSTDTLRPSVLQAMRALKAKGILTAIATGRTPAALPAKVQQLIAEAEMDLLVMINGQYIRYQGEVLQKHPLKQTQIADMQVFFEEHNIPYAFVSEQTIAVSERLPWVEVVLAEILPEHPIDKDYFKKHEVYQMLGFYPQQQDDLVAARAQQSGLKTIRWHEQSVDMLDEQGSKARGIATAIARLGIDMKDVMAFGDGLNDIEMMQTVGFGVGMGNGRPELKAVVDYICPTVEEDGVFNGLKALGVID